MSFTKYFISLVWSCKANPLHSSQKFHFSTLHVTFVLVLQDPLLLFLSSRYFVSSLEHSYLSTSLHNWIGFTLRHKPSYIFKFPTQSCHLCTYFRTTCFHRNGVWKKKHTQSAIDLLSHSHKFYVCACLTTSILWRNGNVHRRLL